MKRTVKVVGNKAESLLRKMAERRGVSMRSVALGAGLGKNAGYGRWGPGGPTLRTVTAMTHELGRLHEVSEEERKQLLGLLLPEP